MLITLTCRTVFPRVPHITDTHARLCQVRFTVSVIVTVGANLSFLAAHARIHNFQWCFKVIHILIVGYPSYTAIESRIVQIGIRNAWVLYTSDLKRPKAVQVTESDQIQWN